MGDLPTTLSEAQAEIIRLRSAINAQLEGAIDRPMGEPHGDPEKYSKFHKCIHGLYFYEACESCIDAHFEATIQDTPND